MITSLSRVRRALRHSAVSLCGAVALALVATDATAQWVTVHEQFYLQAKHNWEFRDRYQAADRLFNAFDYGHAILYETLWTSPDAPVSELEEKEYNRLTKRILVNPPRLPLEEGAIEIDYARLAPEAKAMFEWAHVLHRQIYDVWADESIPVADKDRHVDHLLAYYKSRPEVAFSSRPKSMALMQEQPYSLAFRQRYPKFNGLIWAYHWLQVGLYEPLIVGNTVEQRQALVRATVGRFWQMLERPVETMPYQMPMTAAVAPVFASRYPEAAIIFDNLHSMHDVISDILANDAVPRGRKRAEIVRASRLFRDDTSYVMPVAAWRTMSLAMGVENMGGPAVGFTPALPSKSVTYGAVMLHDEQTGEMTGLKVGEMTGEHRMERMEHGAPPRADSARVQRDRMQGIDHRMHTPSGPDSAGRQPTPGRPDDSATVASVVARFHAALAAGDSAAALELIAPDAVILESGGIETREEYRSHHLPADIAFARAVRSVWSPVQVTVRGDVAWAASTSTAEGEFRGRAVNSAGAELMVLVRQGDSWRIGAIHWSSRARRS